MLVKVKSFAHQGIGMWLIVLVLLFVPVSAPPKLRRALTAAFLLRGIGYIVEGVAHITFNQGDGLGLALAGRAVVIVSLFLWLALSTGIGEVLLEGSHVLWLTSWVISFLFLPVALTLLFLFSQHSTIVGTSAAGVVDLYWASIWCGVASTSWIRGGTGNAYATAMLTLAASGSIFLAATENLCGPPAHASCYEGCFMNAGGWYSLLGCGLCLLGHLFAVGFWLLDPASWPANYVVYYMRHSIFM